MGKRHNTLSDDIFRNSNYINTLEQALGIEDFKKEYKEQFEIMLNIYKTLIVINNIIFSDSNKTINDKIMEVEIELEKCLFGTNDNDSEKYQYSTRTIKGLIDSNTRHLFNKFTLWYDYLMGINKLDLVKNEVEEEMQALDNIDFDKVIKDTLIYEKNKDSNYKIFISKFNNLYNHNNEFIEEYKKNYEDNYGITLAEENIKDISFIYNMVARANNGIVKIISKEKIQDFKLSTRSMPEDYYKAYLTSLHIDTIEDNLFMALSRLFIKEILAVTEDIDESLSVNEIMNHFDYYYFLKGIEKVVNANEIKINNDLLNKIIKDLKEIYDLIIDKENLDNFKIAFKKVQAIIDRNKNYFERLS